MQQLGVFESVEQAIEAAYNAQIELAKTTTMQRDAYIQAIKDKISPLVEQETIREFEETGYGRLEQKIIKNIGSVRDNPGTEALRTTVMASSAGLTVEYDAPYGLIGALTPVTNGLVTVACNTMCMIAGGNTVTFNAHPAGKEAAANACHLVNEAIIEAGGPANCCTMVRIPTMETLDVIMNDPRVSLLIGTGGEGMVKTLMSSSKKVIAAGPGNPPVIVDATADVKAAASTLYEMVPFENNLLCITEKEAFVEAPVYDEFIEHMVSLGARLLTDDEAAKVAELCVIKTEVGQLVPNKSYVGKDANVILAAAGVKPSDFDLQLCIVKAAKDYPFVACEQMMPIFPVVKCDSFDDCVEQAVKAEAGKHHSAAIWSRDIQHITDFGRIIGTTNFAANGSTAAGTGMGGTGTITATIATGTGEGFTDPSTFCRRRRMALGGGLGYIV